MTQEWLIIIKTMDKIVDFYEYQPHNVAEVICVKCGKRWLAVWPAETWLKDLECENCGAGFVVKTGQDLDETDDNK